MGHKVCVYCKTILDKKWQQKFCSNQCQADFRFSAFKVAWMKGKKVSTVNVSRYIKRFLLEKFGEECQDCGWNKKHPVTNRVPLEVEHVDADASNNSLKNLKLLCPNCHALTPTFRNLNKGNGRAWRKRYL